MFGGERADKGLDVIDRTVGVMDGRRPVVARLLLPFGWAMSAIGYYGPWIAHKTSALAISGVDMGEFVKFLPCVVGGTLPVVRQWFYLPPVAIVLGVALLARSRHLRYPWPLQMILLVLAIPVSLQLLPPAWSPGSLLTAEFRLQAIALAICWLLLAGAGFLARLSVRLRAALAALLGLTAAALSTWQMMVSKPSIDDVYGAALPLGWGYFVCMGGLAAASFGSLFFLTRTRDQGLQP